jgi:hypothetical protein
MRRRGGPGARTAGGSPATARSGRVAGLLLALLLSACGVKAPPRPPAPDRPEAPAAAPTSTPSPAATPPSTPAAPAAAPASRP